MSDGLYEIKWSIKTDLVWCVSSTCFCAMPIRLLCKYPLLWENKHKDGKCYHCIRSDPWFVNFSYTPFPPFFFSKWNIILKRWIPIQCSPSLFFCMSQWISAWKRKESGLKVWLEKRKRWGKKGLWDMERKLTKKRERESYWRLNKHGDVWMIRI